MDSSTGEGRLEIHLGTESGQSRQGPDPYYLTKGEIDTVSYRTAAP